MRSKKKNCLSFHFPKVLFPEVTTFLFISGLITFYILLIDSVSWSVYFREYLLTALKITFLITRNPFIFSGYYFSLFKGYSYLHCMSFLHSQFFSCWSQIFLFHVLCFPHIYAMMFDIILREGLWWPWVHVAGFCLIAVVLSWKRPASGCGHETLRA